MKLHGIIPPVVTPMTAGQESDSNTLWKCIAYLLGCRIHGIFKL